MTFDNWIQQVDALLEEKTGIGSPDHPDWVWCFSYENRDPPSVAVESFLEETYGDEW